MITTKQKILAISAHLGYFIGIGYVLIPLAILLLCDEEDFLKEHAKQALCVQVVFGIASAIVGVLTSIIIGIVFWPFLGILWFMWFVCSLKGAWRALNGEAYSYPLTGNIVAKL